MFCSPRILVIALAALIALIGLYAAALVPEHGFYRFGLFLFIGGVGLIAWQLRRFWDDAEGKTDLCD